MIPIHISNVSLWLEDEKSTTKVGFFIDEENKKSRRANKFNIPIN
jgi:ribosomal protein L24